MCRPSKSTTTSTPAAAPWSPRCAAANAPRLPAYVCLPNPPPSANAAYLGVAYNPFTPGSDPSSPSFKVRDLRARAAHRPRPLPQSPRAAQGRGQPPPRRRYRGRRRGLRSLLPRRLRHRHQRRVPARPSTSTRKSRVSAIAMAGIQLGPKRPAGPAARRGGRHLRDRQHGRLGHAHQQLPASSRTSCCRATTRPWRPWWRTCTIAAWTSKVLVMTYGEFGRTPRINTDVRPRSLAGRRCRWSSPAAA